MTNTTDNELNLTRDGLDTVRTLVDQVRRDLYIDKARLDAILVERDEVVSEVGEVETALATTRGELNVVLDELHESVSRLGVSRDTIDAVRDNLHVTRRERRELDIVISNLKIILGSIRNLHLEGELTDIYINNIQDEIEEIRRTG